MNQFSKYNRHYIILILYIRARVSTITKLFYIISNTKIISVNIRAGYYICKNERQKDNNIIRLGIRKVGVQFLA